MREGQAQIKSAEIFCDANLLLMEENRIKEGQIGQLVKYARNPKIIRVTEEVKSDITEYSLSTSSVSTTSASTYYGSESYYGSSGYYTPSLFSHEEESKDEISDSLNLLLIQAFTVNSFTERLGDQPQDFNGALKDLLTNSPFSH